GPALAQDLALLEDAVDAADRGAEDDAHARGVEAVEAGVLHRLARGAEREQDVPLELAHVLRRRDLRRVEVLHLGCDAHGQPVDVEGADPVDAAAARDGGLPGRLGVVADRRDGPEPGDGDASHPLKVTNREVWANKSTIPS